MKEERWPVENLLGGRIEAEVPAKYTDMPIRPTNEPTRIETNHVYLPRRRVSLLRRTHLPEQRVATARERDLDTAPPA